MDRAKYNEFMKKVCVLVDTRERENKHILDALDKYGVKVERRKLDYGDYSFTVDNRDFSMSCVVERKANVDELYQNTMQDRGRIEKEFEAASTLSNEFTLLIECVDSWEALRQYEVPDWQMAQNPQRVVKDIGNHVHNTLKCWEPDSRYGFRVEFVPDRRKTAGRLLEVFYYYWYNYKKLTSARR